MSTTPHTIRLTADQYDRLTDHGRLAVGDAVRSLIDANAPHPSDLPRGSGLIDRAHRITITVHLSPKD